ncbi:hypothetical protein AX17_005776 [Amanita inopinata Kibby_2008]|nr:hypothetical protein AX17_005776 [Amanita inopinata Kibby_2008]
MSEYWVSKKKYFCKYCEIYIADDVPSRQQHENGLRHQGNRERFIRNIYKSSERKKKDLEEEKRELARVEQAAQAAFAQDVGAGHARPVSSSASVSAPAPRKPPPKPSNPYADYTTAASLGYTDPDVERAAAEAERRRTQGVAGEWQIVTSPPPVAPAPEAEPTSDTSSTQVPAKREAETPADDDHVHHFKLRKKVVGTGLTEIYDPGVIPIKVKTRGEPTPFTTETKIGENPVASSSVLETEDEKPRLSEGSKWVKVQWRRPGEPLVNGEQGQTGITPNTTEQGKVDEVKQENEVPFQASLTLGIEEPFVKTEPEEVTNIEDRSIKREDPQSAPTNSGSLFKKRKAPASVSTGKRR